MGTSELELDLEQLNQLGERVVNFITRYFISISQKPVFPEHVSPRFLRSLFQEPLPMQPQGVQAALDDFEQKVAANSTRVGHPRFLGWIRTSPVAMAVYSEALAAALNQSVAVWEGAPASTEVELRVLEWIKELAGYARSASGILTSGGSMANFICMLAARSAADPAVREEGLFGRIPLTLYLTAETHYCVLKAAEMMGIGRRQIRLVPTTPDLRMDAQALASAIEKDLQAGLRPMAVAATMGTVNTGACDDLPALSEVCQKYGVWLHVDGAYGGLASLVAEKRYLANGLDQADSLVCDPHKSLYIPFEAGCALVKKSEHLLAAFATQADYLPNSDPLEDDGISTIHFRDYGPQLSRSFRALKIYLTLKAHGVEAIARTTARQYALAAELGERTRAAPDFELMAPVTLGITAFRYTPPVPAGIQNREDWLDQLNQRIAAGVQARGDAFLSATRIQGKVSLRACFVSYRTQEEDIDRILAEVRQVGRQL